MEKALEKEMREVQQVYWKAFQTRTVPVFTVLHTAIVLTLLAAPPIIAAVPVEVGDGREHSTADFEELLGQEPLQTAIEGPDPLVIENASDFINYYFGGEGSPQEET